MRTTGRARSVQTLRGFVGVRVSALPDKTRSSSMGMEIFWIPRFAGNV